MRPLSKVHCVRFALLAGAMLAANAASASHTGVCPDGSIYIVQDVRQIPCADAKPIDSDEVPPIRPEYLPTPYTWKVWNERNSPNNPYNLIDAARQVREARAAEAAGAALRASEKPAPAPEGGATQNAAPQPLTPPDEPVDSDIPKV